MVHSNVNKDNDSITLDFFESEGNQTKLYNAKGKQIDYSKIVTKAIIETNPLNISKPNILKNTNHTTNISNRKHKKEDSQNFNDNIDCLSSPSSSFERQLLDESNFDESLLNCLAYNETDSFDTQDLSSFLLEDKECSNNSLSDSTITTVTSDLTSVSPFSSMSSSTCTSEEFVAISSSKNENKNDFPEELNGGERSEIDEHETESISESTEESVNINTESDKLLNKKLNNGADDFENEYASDSMILNEHTSLSEIESNISVLGDELRDISLASQSTKSRSLRTPLWKESKKQKACKRENLTFKREELIKIERDNLILLKKIMAHSKPRTVSLYQPFSHKKTSAAINRAKQQKKIEQDNYILFSKISAIGRTKKVF